MKLNATNLQDLICITEIAEAYYESQHGLPEEKTWMERIERYQALFKAELDRVSRSAKDQLCLIWSQEHGAWWMPASSGYTRNLNHAGLYSLEQAALICEDSNRYSKSIMEIAIPCPNCPSNE